MGPNAWQAVEELCRQVLLNLLQRWERHWVSVLCELMVDDFCIVVNRLSYSGRDLRLQSEDSDERLSIQSRVRSSAHCSVELNTHQIVWQGILDPVSHVLPGLHFFAVTDVERRCEKEVGKGYVWSMERRVQSQLVAVATRTLEIIETSLDWMGLGQGGWPGRSCS